MLFKRFAPNRTIRVSTSRVGCYGPAMRVSDLDLLIVPRHGGGAEGDWPARWRAKLSTARFVTPADAVDPRLDAWTAAVADAARELRRPVLFVGHGSGGAVIVEAARALGGADVRARSSSLPRTKRALRA